MTELEKNRVFDCSKLQTLRNVGRNLFSVADGATRTWDIAIASVKSLDELLPEEIKSPQLAAALANVPENLKNAEYVLMGTSFSNTLGKLSENMPLCDTQAAVPLTFTTQVMNLCAAMIRDLAQYIEGAVADYNLVEYAARLSTYKVKWDETCEQIDTASEQVQEIMIGLPQYTRFYGDPVNMSTGNFTYTYTDLDMEGSMPVTFSRFYNAMDKNKGVLGRGWIHNWETHLTLEDDAIKLMHEDGREESFLPDGQVIEDNGIQAESYISSQDVQRMILKIDGFYYYRDSKDRIRCFDGAGRFLRIQDEDKRGITLSYEDDRLSFVIGDTGAWLRFTYNERGQLTAVEDAAGRTVRYIYDRRKLVRVTDPQGREFSYAYGENGRIERITDKRGVAVLENGYDDNKRIVWQKFPDGGIMKFDYQDFANRICVTEQNGNRITYVHDRRYRSIETIYEDGRESWRYDENNNCTSHTDKRGNTTKWEYDDQDRVICAVNPLSDCRRTEYDSEGRTCRITYPDGGTDTREYDSEGRLVETTDREGGRFTLTYEGAARYPQQICLPDGSSMEMSYDDRGNITRIGYPDGTSISYRYDKLNRVVESRDGNDNSTGYAYDEMGRITEVVRADGAKRTYRYNEMGEALEIRDFDGQTAFWEYNLLNKPESYTDKCGRRTLMEYDIMWNLAKITDPEGGVQEYVYDAMNRLAKVTDQVGRSVTFSYDADGNRTQVGYPDGTAVKYEYDALNRVTAVTDENGNVTRFFYDSMGNMVRKVEGDGSETLWEYDRKGNRIKETDGTGAVTLYTYTSLGRPKTVTGPSGAVTRYHYGPGGRLLRKEESGGSWETYEYDGAGNILKRLFADGSSIGYQYDALNRVTEIYRGEILERAYEYDAMGHITASVDALGNRTQYRYTPEGKLAAVTDPMGGQVRYDYNGCDQLTAILRLSKQEAQEFPEDGLQEIRQFGAESLHLTLFGRNAAGQVEEVREESGRVLTYHYDAMGRIASYRDSEGRETYCRYGAGGRLEETVYPDGKQAAFSYDALNRLSLIHDWLGDTAFSYDEAGRLTGVTDHRGERTEYGWNPDGTRKWVKYPDGERIDYRYDAAMRPLEITSGSFRISYGYDGAGRLSEIHRGNGIDSFYSYDREGRMREIIHRGAEGVLERFTYGYDVLGNRIREERISSSGNCGYRRSYGYDALGRLWEVYQEESLFRSYVYDAYGDRINSAAPAGDLRPVLDCRGRLAALESGNAMVQENSYNGLGCRTFRSESGVISQQYPDYADPFRRVIMEKAEGSHNQRYLWQGDTLLGMPGQDSYVLTDALHTPICVTDDTGRVQSVYQYDEYGVPELRCEGTRLPFGFTGYQTEAEPGLYHANARVYDSRQGRFLTRDAYRYMEFDDPVSLNLYLYGKGNPLRYVDPSGNVCIEEHAYLKQTVRHVILGNYTDDVTMVGVGIDVLLGMVGLDLPMDIRDICAACSVNFNPTELSWWGMMFVDCVGVLPLIGSLKYVDELGALGKNAVKGVSKHWDEAWDGLKHSDDIWEGLAAVFKIGRKNSDEAVRGIREVIEATNKRLGELDELAEAASKRLDELDEVAEAAGKRLDGVDKIDEIAEVVEGGRGVKYSPANPGPLTEEVANSFNGATYTERVLTEDTVMYRVSGGKAGEVGSYMSMTPQGGGLQSQLDLALNPAWGNTTENVTKVVVPKGTTIYEGIAAPQNIYDSLDNVIGTLPGGGNQVYISTVEAGWFQ